MRLYIATPINARQEPTKRGELLAAKHRVEMLKEILSDDSRFRDWEMTSTFDLPHGSVYDEAQALGLCVSAVISSDAIYLDHGWTASKGCNLEYRAAKIYGKQIIRHDEI